MHTHIHARTRTHTHTHTCAVHVQKHTDRDRQTDGRPASQPASQPDRQTDRQTCMIHMPAPHRTHVDVHMQHAHTRMCISWHMYAYAKSTSTRAERFERTPGKPTSDHPSDQNSKPRRPPCRHQASSHQQERVWPAPSCTGGVGGVVTEAEGCYKSPKPETLKHSLTQDFPGEAAWQVRPLRVKCRRVVCQYPGRLLT